MILWCLHHDWPKDVKIQNRIRSPNLVLLLSTTPNLHTGMEIHGYTMWIGFCYDELVSSVYPIWIYNLGKFLTRWWIGMLFLGQYYLMN